MILPASYSNGFAPRDGQPLYPELWRGCVGAWAPCLGPTGLTLRDWSGFGHHGTLTNMDTATDWASSSGRYAVDLDGSNDFISCGSAAFFAKTDPFSGSAWIRPTTGSRTESIFAKWAVGTSAGWQFQKVSGKPSLYLVNSSGVSYFYAESTTILSSATWCHVGFSYDGSVTGAGIRIYVNGKESAVTTGTLGSGDPGTLVNSDLWIGSRNAGSPSTPFLGEIDDVRVNSGVLTPSRFALLGSRRGIAYELDQRRRASVQVAASFNRRRRLLLGAS